MNTRKQRVRVMSEDKLALNETLPKDVYIEFGGGSASKGLADRDEFVRVFKGAARRMRYIHMCVESQLITTVVNREARMLSSPFYMYVTKLEYKALSRALRLNYFDPAQPEYGTQDGGTGKGNDRYQRFMAICRRSHRLVVNRLDELCYYGPLVKADPSEPGQDDDKYIAGGDDED